jgi:hypothetical protein
MGLSCLAFTRCLRWRPTRRSLTKPTCFNTPRCFDTIGWFGDYTLAEDVLQDALVVALESWVIDGVPCNPGAWLMTVELRRAATLERRAAQLDSPAPQNEPEEVDSIPEERLKLRRIHSSSVPSLAFLTPWQKTTWDNWIRLNRIYR